MTLLMTTLSSIPLKARGHREAHTSVMTAEVLKSLNLQKGDVVLDATAGQGGHSEALLQKSSIRLIALDADKEAVEASTVRLKRFAKRMQIVEGNFADTAEVLKRLDVSFINKAVFDLGWNRGQLHSGRGFSFLQDEPLNMSYGATPHSGFSAADILNKWSEKALADVLFGYGEERYARPIARAVVARRKIKPLNTTIELVEIIRDAVPAVYRRGRLHPATRSFQALRVAVNDELKVIEKGLQTAWEHLACNGRIVVISFHSIEDRLVKQTFRRLASEGGHVLYKKPLIASRAENIANPSARSAKLRAIEKICNK